MNRENITFSVEVIITTYKQSGKFYHRQKAMIKFKTNMPMLDDNFKELIISNTGVGEKPFITYSCDDGRLMFCEGIIILK